MSSYKTYRNNNLDVLQKELAKMQQKSTNTESDSKNEGFWSPTVDKAGNGSAVIRFLPAVESETCPWVRYWDHGFQGPTGKWYIENSLTTLNLKDPVGESNSVLWKSGDPANIELARKRKRRLHFVSNIKVIKDSANPENEGKVFYFRYGKKIFDKVQAAMLPTDEQLAAGVEPVNIFDMVEGSNFLLSIKKVSGYRNYDDSAFLKQTPAAVTDDEIDALWGQCKPLLPFIAPDKFKSWDELKKRFDDVIDDTPQSPFSDEKPKAAPFQAKEARAPEMAGAEPQKDDEMEYFRGLVEDDD